MMTLLQLRHTASALSHILTFQQPADVALSAYFRAYPKLGRQDRHEIAETVFASLRHYQKIQQALPDPLQQTTWTALSALVLVRSVGISQLQGLLDEPSRAFLSQLKAQKEQFKQNLNTQAELPEWLIAQLRHHWQDEEILAFGRSACQSAPLDLRVNALKAKRDQVLKQLQEQYPNACATPFSPHGIRLSEKIPLNQHPLFLDGTLEVQDEGSQLLAQLVQAKRNEIVVDFCAGAGGKTLALGAQMHNKGRIYAFDVADKRLAKLKPRMARAGLSNIHPQLIDHEQDAKVGKLSGKAHRVLVDAPCSGLGTLRRNPDLKYRHNADTLRHLQAQQASILQASARLLMSGGRLVYATCSVLPEENQQQVEQFLHNHRDFELLNASEILQMQKIGLDSGTYLQLSTAKHQTDGFFAAVLQKK